MIVCDRCRKPARIFAYGDLTNESFETTDLCHECTKELIELIWKFRKEDKRESDGGISNDLL